MARFANSPGTITRRAALAALGGVSIGGCWHRYATPADEAAALLIPPPGTLDLTREPDLVNSYRSALVIGNQEYQPTPLRNPRRDAESFAAVLGGCGFHVQLENDLNKQGLEDVFRDFFRNSKDYGCSLIYYAGHAIGVDGDSYLVPLDADIDEARDVGFETISLNFLISAFGDLTEARRIAIIVLDACRNNPFERRWRGMEGGMGLVSVSAPANMLVAYASAPGRTADDGGGLHSLYTGALLDVFRRGMSVSTIFRRTRQLVIDRARVEGIAQIPWESSSLLIDPEI